jgi:hypothetical protein
VPANVVTQEWRNVDRMQGFAAAITQTGWAFQSVTNLRLQPQSVEKLFTARCNEIAGAMVRDVRQLRALDSFPPDAQLAILVHAWAVGPRGLGRNLRAACERRDWRSAARHSGWGGGAHQRLVQVRIMFNNADVVSDPRPPNYPTRVYWPQRLISVDQGDTN